jgi:hypothetical protein
MQLKGDEMTTPTERTRALRQAWALLSETSRRSDVPDDVKHAAIAVLRHFPGPKEIADEAHRSETRGLGPAIQIEPPWLLPEL